MAVDRKTATSLIAGAAALCAATIEPGHAQQPRPLPYAEGKSFETLDAYLAHLASLGPIGVPFFLEVAPGLYERQLQRLAPGEAPPRFTREALRQQFGFER